MLEVQSKKRLAASTTQKAIYSDAVKADSVEVLDDISKLDTSWLKLAAPVYHISPNLNDYVITMTILTISDLPNRNGIAFPLEELTRFQEPPLNHLAYKGWSGAPVFTEHQNTDNTKASGVVFDVRLRPIIGYNNNKLYKVIGVVGIDKTKNPELARRVASGEVNTYSMGALADYFTCSYCGAVIDDKHTCKHIHGSADNVNFNRIVDYEGKVHVAFLNAHNLSPFELSVVEDPAWTAALSDTILQS